MGDEKRTGRPPTMTDAVPCVVVLPRALVATIDALAGRQGERSPVLRELVCEALLQRQRNRELPQNGADIAATIRETIRDKPRTSADIAEATLAKMPPGLRPREDCIQAIREQERQRTRAGEPTMADIAAVTLRSSDEKRRAARKEVADKDAAQLAEIERQREKRERERPRNMADTAAETLSGLGGKGPR